MCFRSGGVGAGADTGAHEASAAEPSEVAVAAGDVAAVAAGAAAAVGAGAAAGDATATINAHSATPEQKEAFVHRTFESISQNYDLMNDVESFGLHRGWKKALIRRICERRPKAVLDVACGTGDIALALAAKLPQSRITGYDFSANMLAVARARALELPAGLGDSLNFVEGNALSLPFDDASFDAVSISFGLRNVASYETAIREMTRVLRPGGCWICLEASYPTNVFIKPLFKLYFKHIMPWMAKVVTRKLDEYKWLNDSTEAFLSKEQLSDLMYECGLLGVYYKSFALGAAALHVGCKPPADH